MKRFKILVVLSALIAMQGCTTITAALAGRIVKDGGNVYVKAKDSKYKVQVEIVKALKQMNNTTKDAAIAAGIPFDRVSQLSDSAQAVFMENYFKFAIEKARADSYANVALAAHGKTSQSEVIRQAMAGTNVSSNNLTAFGKNALNVAGALVGAKILLDPLSAAVGGAAARLSVKGNGNNITYADERLNYNPKTTGQNAPISGTINNHNPNEAGGIPVNPADISDIALGEGRPAPQCPPGFSFRPDGVTCSDGNGNSAPPITPGLTPEPDPVPDVEL